jgi:hypothetical protein
VAEISYHGVSFTLSDKRDQPSFFVLGVRKSGSSLLNKMVRPLAVRQQLNYIDIPRHMFEAGKEIKVWRDDPSLAILISGGNVYGGFRNAPLSVFANPAFQVCRKVLLVRDPRDALVSEYFSNAYSHNLPKEEAARERFLQMRRDALEATVDAYVRKQAPFMAKTLMEYVPLMSDPLTKLYRYEDIITQKRSMLESISAHFGWPTHSRHLDNILRGADVFPTAEKPTEFIRRVTPGDHREKLSAETIAHLDEVLAKPAGIYGYAN